MPSLKKTKYRDMQKFNEFRKRSRQQYYGRTDEFGNRKVSWTIEEDNKVLEHNITDFELAQELGRTIKSIQTRRYKLRKSITKNGRED